MREYKETETSYNARGRFKYFSQYSKPSQLFFSGKLEFDVKLRKNFIISAGKFKFAELSEYLDQKIDPQIGSRYTEARIAIACIELNLTEQEAGELIKDEIGAADGDRPWPKEATINRYRELCATFKVPADENFPPSEW